MKKKLLILSATVLGGMLLSACGERPKGSGDSSGGGGSGDNSDSGIVSTGTGEASDSIPSGDSEYEDMDYHGIVRVYYHNDANNYATKRIWAWSKGVDGKEYPFVNQSNPDSYGVYADFDLSSGIWKDSVSATFSFIIKEAGTWSGQSTDTICPYGKFYQNYDAASNMLTIYACDGEGGNIDTFVKREDALGDRVGTAYFSDWKKLHVEGAGQDDGRSKADIGKVASYELYAYDAAYEEMTLEEKTANKGRYLIKTGTPGTNSFDIALDEEIKPYYSYVVEARMTLDTSRLKSKVASVAKLYDTKTFIDKYTYSGKDLGVTVDEDGATFKLWAPTSSRVQLKIYGTGTPGDLHETFQGSSNWGSVYEMEYGNYGVWQLRVEDYDFYNDPSPYYYTYIVTNSAGTNETIDPYATGAGINGVRGAVISWDKIEKPANWDNIASGKLLTDIDRPNELTVYEAHIRDLTADATWTGDERPGTYNAFIEEGTYYSGTKADGTAVDVKTGFDHIKELGVNAIQLLPVFDADNDERWRDAEGNLITEQEDFGKEVEAPAYNWNYNPLNYNIVEGCYSSNAFHALTRIKEYRNLVSKCADNDIRVIMDVVYNHFASVNGNPLQKVVPGYFLRTMDDGSFYDGSGCGNVTASERAMMSKFIVDSCVFWAKTYKIKGFRFDLMGCLDVDTMRKVKDALFEIDRDIVVYGEGWAGLGDGGFYDVVYAKYPNAKPANTGNVYTELYDKGKGSVGGFNDCFRDGLKGNTKYGDVTPEWGYITKGPDDLNNDLKKYVGEGLLGSNEWQGQHTNNEQSVNYAACHDNYGLYDQLNYCINSQTKADIDPEGDEVLFATVACNAAAILNQGIAFINGGDEIFRQKVMKPNDPLLPKMEESIKGIAPGHEWIEGDGIKMASGNYLVRNSYQYGDAVNSFKWDRKAKYLDYYANIKEAVEVRKASMGNIFGRAYTEIQGRNVNNVFDSTYDSANNPLVALYMGGKVDSANYYIAFGGRSNDTWSDLTCGNCNIEVIYSSTQGRADGSHYKGQSFPIENEKLGAGKYEFLIVKAS